MIIDPQTLVDLGAVCRRYEKGQTVFYEGDPSRYYYQILTGAVSLMNVGEDGHEFIQGLYEEGECVGTAALLIGEPYPANAVAVTDVSLVRMSKGQFFGMLREDPQVLLEVTLSIAAKLYHKSCINKCMATQRPEERISSLLNMLKKESGCADEEPYRLRLSRQQIADMIGLRVETVIRTVKKLEEKGLVSIEHGKVYY